MAFSREIRNGAELRVAARDRIEELNITRLAVDELARLTPGYAAKLLCDPPVKGGSGADALLKLLIGIGLKIVLVSDDDAPVQAWQRDRRQVRRSSEITKVRRYLRRIERLLDKVGSKT